MNAIDTNIWIYSHDSRDPRKQLLARTLISTARPLALPWQVGCEFIAATRKLAPTSFHDSLAWAALADMQLIADTVVMPVPQLWSEAQMMQARHTLAFWDAMLVAACIHGGVDVLYSEDMGAPRQIDSLCLVNPFTLTP